MIVQCETCQTKFKLDDTRLTDEGAWVRCSRCQDVFHVPGAAPAPKAQDFFELSAEPGQAAAAAEDADFGLDVDAMTRRDDRAKGGRTFKLLFWLIILPLILILVLVGGLVALDRFNLLPQVVNPLRSLPGLNLILGAGADSRAQAGKPGAKDATSGQPTVQAEYRGLKLNQVRAYYRMNQKSGRLFVVQGLVQNDGDQARVRVMVRGQLNDAQGKTAAQAVVHAGQTLTTEELHDLSFEEIKARLDQPPTQGEQPLALTAGGNLPFMIVFANLPSNLSEYAADVMDSAPAPPAGVPR